ncbi:MAG: NUDIX hydrolase, partial [Anaerolineae bacterium]|nr:NUDIX hydrolase [Anaerolineae bacterium]
TYSENKFDIERYHHINDIAVEIISTYSETDMPVIKNIFDSQTGYLTPKVDARGVIFKDGKILLVKELSDGGWTLPGGWMDVDETPGEAVAREVREEAGYEVRADKLLFIYDRRLHGHPAYMFHVYKLFFLCELIGGQAATSIETGGAVFFGLDELPPLSVERTTLEEIERCFYHYDHPDTPTEFD